jgi:hypothetical protein
VFYALAKKVNFIGGAKSGNDFIILHLTAEIPRAFRTTLFYHMFITIPLSKAGFEGTVNLYRKIRGEVGLEPFLGRWWFICFKTPHHLLLNGFL